MKFIKSLFLLSCLMCFLSGCSFPVYITLKLDKAVLDEFSGGVLVVGKQGPHDYGPVSQYIKDEQTIQFTVCNTIPYLIRLKSKTAMVEFSLDRKARVCRYPGGQVPITRDSNERGIILDLRGRKIETAPP